MKKKHIKFRAENCEEMVGLDITKDGVTVGKVIKGENDEATAEVSEEVHRQFFSPVLNCSMGVRVKK